MQEIRGISLVFREMWDTTGLDVKIYESCKKSVVVSHLARNERDVGYPGFFENWKSQGRCRHLLASQLFNEFSVPRVGGGEF